MTAAPVDGLGLDPAVVTWRIALAPRPRFTTRGKHWWRDLCVDAFRSATHAWELAAEAASVGYATELKEFAEQHQRPRYRDFLVQLSVGTLAPDRACSCGDWHPATVPCPAGGVDVPPLVEEVSSPC